MFAFIFLITLNVIQFFTAFWSLFLIKAAKKHLSWILISSGLFIIAINGLIITIRYTSDKFPLRFIGLNDWLNLLFSALIVIGVILIGEVFFSINREEKTRIESENKFKTLFNNSIDEIYVVDFKENFIEVNNVTCDVLGYSREELMNMRVACIKSAKYADVIDSLIKKIIDEGHITFESEHISKSGKIIPVEIKSRVIDYEGKKAILSIARDITERKQTERKILNAIIETEEKERERFAKDLHDGLGTILSSINIYISLIKSCQIDETERKNLLDNTKGLIDEAILNAKDIANNLRPNVISRFGLVASINSLCEKINNTGVMKIIFNSNNIKNDELNKDIEVSLYRIINELINNTLKHAHASDIRINLLKENEFINLTYTDNGIGFDVEETMNKKNHQGIGLSNIMSRVKAINGVCQINSSSKKGIEVFIKVKL